MGTIGSSDTVLVDKQTTTTTVTETPQEPRGILSTTFHVLGEVIALPFRLIGALFRAIF